MVLVHQRTIKADQEVNSYGCLQNKIGKMNRKER
jgi:hypothetical protein